MNHKAFTSAVVALTMAATQAAFAQGNRDRHERGGQQSRQPEHRVAAASQHDRRGFGRAHEAERRKGRGAGPNNEYYRGDRLPAEYRHRNYVVDHWRDHHLSAPPRGYQWVQYGGDYLLVAVATGIIAQLLLAH
jgi:Ni/Co efflux regulator RcnB